jgi:hypothetical protein
MESNSPGGFFADLRTILSDVFLGVVWDERQERTFEVLFRLLGHLSRLDGIVSREERSVAIHAMDELGMPATLRERALAAFDGQSGGRVDLRGELERYLEVFRVGSPQLEKLCDCLGRLARADGHVSSRERAFLDELNYVLRISDHDLRVHALENLALG